MAEKHPVTEYAEKVIKGKIPAGEILTLTCKRHIRDMKTADKRGLFFDGDAASHAINFFDYLRLWEGEWSGCVFELQPWQEFIVGSLFGWKKEDGTRRFRLGYIEVPRKNGKSPLIAGIGLYMLIADNEPGSQVYSAATKRDQAKIVWKHAANMIKRSPLLKGRVEIMRSVSNINVLATESKFEPLGADADTMDGLNIHCGLVDELHAHKKRETWDVLETATSSRRQPLQLGITTAGYDQTTVCWEQHEYGEKILREVFNDDRYFVYISCADEKDDWRLEKTWEKANPNYRISVKPDDIRGKCEKAKNMPGALNAFLRLHLNRWTQQADRWINLDLWDKNLDKELNDADLYGRKCYGGLDLSSISDMTAWVRVFPREDDPELIDVACRFWVPESQLYNDYNRYKSYYQLWKRQGYLKTTPGDAIDYDFIRHEINEDAKSCELLGLNVDRLFQGYQLATQLEEDGLPVFMMGQGFLSMSNPTKELERRLLLKKVNHMGNPILRWMADNVSIRSDPAGGIKPDKSTSQGKIDGIVGLIMAIDRVMRVVVDNMSVYETRELTIL